MLSSPVASHCILLLIPLVTFFPQTCSFTFPPHNSISPSPLSPNSFPLTVPNIQSNYNRANEPCVRVCGNRLLNGWCHRQQNRRLCPRPHSHESVIFFVFLAFILFKLRSLFTHRVHMHLHAHKLCGAHELCMHAEPYEWSAGAHGVTTILGVPLQARRHTAQVMLGLSLRARWDTTLVLDKLEYASAAWDPHSQNNIKTLERIQRQAARFCKNNYSSEPGCVTKLLKELRWETLPSPPPSASPPSYLSFFQFCLCSVYVQ